MNDYTKTSTVVCPSGAIDCPYCDEKGYCHLRTRKTDCDDYGYYEGRGNLPHAKHYINFTLRPEMRVKVFLT